MSVGTVSQGHLLLPCSAIQSTAVPAHGITIYLAVGEGVAPSFLKSNLVRKCSALLIPGISSNHGTDDWLGRTVCLRDTCSPAGY